MANIAVPMMNPATFAPLTVRIRRMPKRISGSACRRADGDVDEEDPLPAERVGEHAAEQDAGRRAEAADRAPDAERDVALAALGERRGEDRQRGGRDDRGAEALER